LIVVVVGKIETHHAVTSSTAEFSSDGITMEVFVGLVVLLDYLPEGVRTRLRSERDVSWGIRRGLKKSAGSPNIN
jgi:hypothetical protein